MFYQTGTYFTGWNPITRNHTAVISDFTTKNYHSAIAAGAIINHACVISRELLEEGGGHWNNVRDSDGQGLYTTGDFFPVQRLQDNVVYIPQKPDPSLHHQHAMQQCLAAIDETPYNFLEDVGEIAETLRFLKSPGRSLLKLARDSQKKSWKIRNNKKMKAQQTADALNDLYLTQRFAMTPLVRSSFDAVDAYNSDKITRPPRVSARGFSSETLSKTGETIDLDFGSYSTKYRRSYSSSVVVRATILYTHSGGTGAAFKLGLRGKDIPVTAWQLVPLSFMVDRVYDISASIRTVMNLSDPRLKILAASVTEKLTDTSTLSLEEGAQPGYTVTASGSGKYDKFMYNRQVWIPSFYDSKPVFIPSNLVKDAQSIADLFSLSGGIISRSFSLY
jgi:hypothetical protein